MKHQPLVISSLIISLLFLVDSSNGPLVLPFMDTPGSLLSALWADRFLDPSDWLHYKQHQTSITLQWNQRVQIAYDVDNAMNYLHKYTTPPYMHKNLKTSNIRLDANFRAKISNFGLARSVDKCDQSGPQLTWNVVGTSGYMAPVYSKNGVLTPQLDIFALGVMMLELLSGREAATGMLEGAGNTRMKLRGFIDPSLRNEYPLHLAFFMAQCARNCVDYDLNACPSIV